jgi:hypothetical protein
MSSKYCRMFSVERLKEHCNCFIAGTFAHSITRLGHDTRQ